MLELPRSVLLDYADHPEWPPSVPGVPHLSSFYTSSLLSLLIFPALPASTPRFSLFLRPWILSLCVHVSCSFHAFHAALRLYFRQFDALSLALPFDCNLPL